MIDEMRDKRMWIEFVVKVSDVFRQGNKKVKPGDIIAFLESVECVTAYLKKGREYAFMGRDKKGKKGERLVLDKSAWVKKWPPIGPTHEALGKVFDSTFNC